MATSQVRQSCPHSRAVSLPARSGVLGVYAVSPVIHRGGFGAKPGSVERVAALYGA